MDCQPLIEAAKAVRRDVAHADVLFDPVFIGDKALFEAESERVQKASDALDELCNALAALEA